MSCFMPGKSRRDCGSHSEGNIPTIITHAFDLPSGCRCVCVWGGWTAEQRKIIWSFNSWNPIFDAEWQEGKRSLSVSPYAKWQCRNRTRDFPVSGPPGHRAKLIKYNFPIQFQHYSVEWPSQDAHQVESTWETKRKKKPFGGRGEIRAHDPRGAFKTGGRTLSAGEYRWLILTSLQQEDFKLWVNCSLLYFFSPVMVKVLKTSTEIRRAWLLKVVPEPRCQLG